MVKICYLLFILTLFSTASQAQCKGIKKDYEKISSRKVNTTLITQPVMMYKFFNGSIPEYNLSLTAEASSTVSGMGVTVFFADESKIQWNNERVRIEITSFHPSWDGEMQAASFIELSDNEAVRFKKSLIKEYILYTHRFKMPKKLARLFRKQIRCLSGSSSNTTD